MNIKAFVLVSVLVLAASGNLWAQKPGDNSDIAAAPPGEAPAGVTDVNYQLAIAPFGLRNISASGTAVPMTDDDGEGPFPIGFSFDFYGNSYTQVHISSNGFISFQPIGDGISGSGCCSGQPLPADDAWDDLVAGFWEDLNPGAGGTVRRQTLGIAPNREFVVGFYAVPHFANTTPVTFEMILHETTNNVELQYGSAPSDGGIHSIGVESEGGAFGTQVIIGDVDFSNEGFLLEPEGEDGEDSLATFPVRKEFDDNNPAEVSVTISCNTGLPLEQTQEISEEDGVAFVVTDFNDGELDCEIVENPVPAGYSADYFENGVFAGEESCVFTEVGFEDANWCWIFNDLEQVSFEVTKEWIDENPQFNLINFAEAFYSCSNAQFFNPSGELQFLGNPGFDSFGVFPHWDGTTTCSVSESLVEGGVEADSSDCESVSVVIGSGASCTIVNTRLFEGIPTLNQYGLALLAMLMLGVGFVAFRRLA